ncbi:MAG: ferredoxin [Candidatus Odinarchaeia archaeon]
MVKVKINKELCIACGSCYAVCSEVYEEDEEGKSKLLDEFEKEGNENLSSGEIPDELKDCATEGAETCPVDAIEIE